MELFLFMQDVNMVYSWTPPRYIRDAPEDEHQAIRNKYHIIVDGNDPVPPITTFKVIWVKDMDVNDGILTI